MVRFGDDRLGQMRHEGLFRFQHILRILGQADTVGHTEDMRVYRHGRLVEGHGHHHVGGLTAYTWEFLQVL